MCLGITGLQDIAYSTIWNDEMKTPMNIFGNIFGGTFGAGKYSDFCIYVSFIKKCFRKLNEKINTIYVIFAF